MNHDCDVHGKVLHPTRKAAKRVARLRGDHMSVYVCGTYLGYHCGHLPVSVKQGRRLRSVLRRSA